jgi:hypothetical protein
MADIKDIIKNIEQIYGSNNSLNLLEDFERVVDELDVYVYENWFDGELVEGPVETRYFVECTFMWPKNKMPNPRGAKHLQEYGCKVQFAESTFGKVRKIKKPDDIRPGTKKGKIDIEEVWMVKVQMPKRLMTNIQRGYTGLDKNKVEDILAKGAVNAQQLEPAQETAADLQGGAGEQPAA